MATKVRNKDRPIGPDGKPRTVLPPVRPNAGVEAQYTNGLASLVREMAASVEYWLRASYRKEEDRIAQDASPAAMMKAAMAKLSRRWLKRFDALGEEMARKMVGATAKEVDAAMKRSLRKAGFTVKFKPTRAQQNIMQASIAENVSLIKSIPQRYLTNVEGDVMRAVTGGFRLDRLMEDLKQYEGVTLRRARTITLDQSRKATAALAVARQRELGITEGIWRHSGGGKEPRQSHKAFSGEVFTLSEGHDFHDGFGKVIPGQAISCRCVWSPVL